MPSGSGVSNLVTSADWPATMAACTSGGMAISSDLREARRAAAQSLTTGARGCAGSCEGGR
eukprot:scaffold105764_cov28-Tisochrysis_lutea.AAC.1